MKSIWYNAYKRKQKGVNNMANKIVILKDEENFKNIIIKERLFLQTVGERSRMFTNSNKFNS